MQIDLLQTQPVTQGVTEAFATLESALTAAKGRGSDLLIAPEMYLTGYNIGAARVAELAEMRDGKMVNGLRDLARKHGLGLMAGFPERGSDGRIYNAAALIEKSGDLVAVVRKTHLYGGIDRAMFSPADQLSPLVEFKGWKVGFAICYDIEFPELVRCHARAGAEIIFCPTANMLPFKGIPNRIVPARAEENEIYVAYANYVGTEGEFDYCGLSCVVGPDGEDRARASLTDAETITARIDRAEFNEIRKHSSHYRDLRPELYQ